MLREKEKKQRVAEKNGHRLSDNQDTRAHFPKLALVHPLRRLLIAGHELVRVSRPGNREQRQQCDNGQGLHSLTVGSDCGQKCQSLVHFVDQA